MIYGLEGVIGLVNLLLFLGAVAILWLVYILLRYKYSESFKNKLKTHSVRYTFGILLLLVLALPTLVVTPWAAYTYVKEKPARDAFERNNQNFLALDQAIQLDDVDAFKLALATCGDYCTKTCDFCDFGKKKYDDLLITAKGMNSSHVVEYIKEINATEKPKPEPGKQYFELEVK